MGQREGQGQEQGQGNNRYNLHFVAKFAYQLCLFDKGTHCIMAAFGCFNYICT